MFWTQTKPFAHRCHPVFFCKENASNGQVWLLLSFSFVVWGKRLLATSTSLSFSRTFVWISKELWERTSHIQGFYTFNNSDDLYISMRDLLHHPKNYYSILKKGLKKPKDWKRGKVYKIPNLYSSGSLQVGCSGVLFHLRKFVRTL